MDPFDLLFPPIPSPDGSDDDPFFKAVVGQPANSGPDVLDVDAFDLAAGLCQQPPDQVPGCRSCPSCRQPGCLGCPGCRGSPVDRNLAALRDVWNTHVALAVGDQVPAPGCQLLVRDLQARHPRQWSSVGTLKVAFKPYEPGLGTVGRVGGTNNQLYAKALVACTFLEAQEQQLDLVAAEMVSRSNCNNWLVLQRAWDETQMVLSYGRPCARTLINWAISKLQRAHKRGNISADEFLARANLVKRLPYGSASVMVQSSTISWGFEGCPGCPGCASGHAQRVKPIMPLCLLQRNRATCIQAGLDRGLPQFSTAKLRDLSKHTDIIFLCLSMDSASSNIRLAKELEVLPSNILVWTWCCDIHLAFRVLSVLMSTLHVLSPLFSLSRLMRISDYHTRFLQAVCRFVINNLQIVEGVAPDPLWKAHSSLVVRYTLLRESLLAAREHPCAPQPRAKPRRDWSAMQQCADQLLVLLNGSWVTPQLIHYCQPGCRHMKAVMAVLAESLEIIFPTLPAENKWQSINNARCFAAFLFQLSGFGCEAFSREWSPDQSADSSEDVPGDGIEDFKAQNQKRLRNAGIFLRDRAKLLELSIFNIISLPVDAFLQFLAYWDNPRKRTSLHTPLLELMMQSHGGPLHELQQSLAKFLEPDSDLVRFLAAYTAPGDFSWGDWAFKSIVFLLNIIAGVFTRCCLRYDTPPVKVFNVLWGSLGERTKAASDWLSIPACCHDEFCKRLSRLSRLSGPDFFLHGPAPAALHEMCSVVGLTIADQERAHAYNRQLGSSTKGPVSLQRLRHESLLKTVMRDHLARGGRNLSVLTGSTVKSSGLTTVRLQRHQKRRARLKIPGNAQMMFTNDWKTKHRLQGLTASSLTRRAREAWAMLSQGQKARWHLLWCNKVAETMEAHRKEQHPQQLPHTYESHLGIGTSDWPVTPSRLDAFLRKHGKFNVQTSGSMPGPCNTGRVVGASDCTRSLVEDQGPGVDLPTVQPPCWRIHPGVCKHVDRDVISNVLSVCENIHHLLSGHSRSDLFGLVLSIQSTTLTEEVNPLNGHVLLLADIRFARPALQIFVRCECQRQDNGGGLETEFALGTPKCATGFRVVADVLKEMHSKDHSIIVLSWLKVIHPVCT